MAKHHIEISGQLGGNHVLRNACMSNDALICQNTMFGGFRIEFDTKKAAKKALWSAFNHIRQTDENHRASKTRYSKNGALYYDASSAIIHRTKQ